MWPSEEKRRHAKSCHLEELALDSLDLVRVIMLIEDRYHTAVDLDEIPKMTRVDDLTRILSRDLRSPADDRDYPVASKAAPHLHHLCSRSELPTTFPDVRS